MWRKYKLSDKCVWSELYNIWLRYSKCKYLKCGLKYNTWVNVHHYIPPLTLGSFIKTISIMLSAMLISLFSSSHARPSWTAHWRRLGGTATTLVTWIRPRTSLWWLTDALWPWPCRQTCRSASWTWRSTAALCSAAESHLYRRAGWWRWSGRNSRSWLWLLVRSFYQHFCVIRNAFIHV